MGENINTGSKTADKTGLVEITFRNQRNNRVTRNVWPEVAEFVRSREAANIAYRMAQTEQNRAMQRYVWEREDAFNAEHPDRYGEFDTYRAQREWQRLPENRTTLTDAEYRYYDFVNASALTPSNRRNAENPNSWEILRKAAEAAGHKVIVWLIDNTLEAESEATLLVKYMPATAAELWEIAKDDNDMCQVFDRYMERAERAGLFEGMEDNFTASIRQQMALRNYIRRQYGHGYARDIMDHVKPIMRAEREEAAAEAVKALQERLVAAVRDGQTPGEFIRAVNAAGDYPVLQAYVNRSDGQRRRGEQATLDRLAATEAHIASEGVKTADVPEPVNIPQISTQSAMTGEIIRSDIKPATVSQDSVTLS